MGLFDLFFGGGGRQYNRTGNRRSDEYRQALREIRKMKSKWYRIVRSTIIFASVLAATLFVLGLAVSDLRHEWLFKFVFIIFALCAGGGMCLPWITEYERDRKRTERGESVGAWRKYVIFGFWGFIGLCTLLWIIAVFVIGNDIKVVFDALFNEGEVEYDFGNTFLMLRLSMIFAIQAAVGSVIAASTIRYGKNYLALRVIMYVAILYLDFYICWFIGTVTVDGLLNGFGPITSTLAWVIAVLMAVALAVAGGLFGAHARRKEVELFMKGKTRALTDGDVDLVDVKTDDWGETATSAATKRAEEKDPEKQLEKIKELLDKGIITEEEYQAKRKDIIDKM